MGEGIKSIVACPAGGSIRLTVGIYDVGKGRKSINNMGNKKSVQKASAGTGTGTGTEEWYTSLCNRKESRLRHHHAKN